MSTPTIPPRPQQRTQPIANANAAGHLPDIPPRPLPKRAVSPANHSPLNEPYHLGRRRSVDPIPRPPSVSRFPTSGEEGMEYGEIQYQPSNPTSAIGADAAAQTRSIDQDLKLHAPKPSLPTTSATAQVQTVTRTDSSQAAAHGIGRAPSQDGEPLGRARSRHSISRPDSAASGDRRRSVYTEEHEYGTAGIGMRVPINPLLGDVQAPSPAPMSPHNTGHTPDGGKKRNHNRTKSGRELHAQPPDSYGLHGHGIAPLNKFDREWYAKHPDQLKHEEGEGHGVYESIGSGRGSFALSSDDLNKIVRDSASRGHGFGTTGHIASYPDEQIGYAASEQYQSRNQTPVQRPSAGPGFPSNVSPLKSPNAAAGDDIDPLDQPVHIDAPARKFNKVTGGEGTLGERDAVKPFITHTDEDDDYKVPILAEDEVAKEIGTDHLQPAVPPVHHRRGSGYDEYGHGEHSRPSSRPGSIYQMHSASHSLTRFLSHQDSNDHVHTPLEDVDEYEPLFPDDDGKKKELSMAERFKRRPETLRHKFPSQDVWEDTPNSLMYETNVSTPDLPREVKESAEADSTGAFETPEKEAARKGEVGEDEKKKLIPAQERLAKSKFAPHLRDDMPTRPGMQPRFPSQDIWEDNPDSQNLVTTVNVASDDEEASPVETKPVVPTRPAKSRLGDGASSDQMAPSVESDLPQRQVHAVPPVGAQLTDISQPPTELKQTPSIPERPKPQIPVRPAKKPDSEALSKVTSQGSVDSNETERDVTSPPVPKTKPQVPARPQGGKIASLRSNFMNDLNQKLGLGPPKEKEPEPELEPEEAKPLEDARKGRARGPQRRAPAKSPGAPPPTQTFSFSMSMPTTLFSINEDDALTVAVAKAEAQMSEDKLAQIEHSTPADAPLAPTVDTTTDEEIAPVSEVPAIDSDAPKALAPSLATNTAGEPADPGSIPAETLVHETRGKENEVARDTSTIAAGKTHPDEE